MTKFQLHIQRFEGGYEITGAEINAETSTEISAALSELASIGIQVSIRGEKTETICFVVRREHIGKDGKLTPVVDLYPAWNGEYGQFRFVGMYLNTSEQIAEFEAQSGLQLSRIPLYESQAPLQRNPARRHKCEVDCKPFDVRKEPDGEKEIDGKKQTVFRFAGYVNPVEVKPVGNPAWWSNVTRSYSQHPAFKNQGETLRKVLHELLDKEVISFDSTVEEVAKVMEKRYPRGDAK